MSEISLKLFQGSADFPVFYTTHGFLLHIFSSTVVFSRVWSVNMTHVRHSIFNVNFLLNYKEFSLVAELMKKSI